LPRDNPWLRTAPSLARNFEQQRGSRWKREQTLAGGCGFTLLELLVVLTVVALATAGVALALPDSGAAQMQREGERLAALLDAARAQSRASGQVVRWRAAAAGQGFAFDGLTELPRHWLHGATHVRGTGAVLWLGPEPLIGAQQVVLVNPTWPQHVVRVATDGLRPFTVERME